MANTIKVHFCGGAGINISRTVFEDLSELGTGFAQLDYHYIDTSKNNISLVTEPKGSFWEIGSGKFDDAAIMGSGGERSKNSAAIVEDLKGYLDHHKISVAVTGEYHMVVFSASGGSGSVIGPMLLRNLLSRGIPAMAVMVGDSSNALCCINTTNTIATLDAVSRKITKQALPVVYINNGTIGGPTDKAIEAANKKLFNSLSVIMLFLSGENADIDSQDMITFLMPTMYKTITVKPGVYGLSVTGDGGVVGNDDWINIVGRTLTVEGVSPDLSLTLLHHKSGLVTDENAINIYEGQFPLHLVSHANFFTAEQEILKKNSRQYQDIMDSLENDDLDGVGDADDDGLVI